MNASTRFEPYCVPGDECTAKRIRVRKPPWRQQSRLLGLLSQFLERVHSAEWHRQPVPAPVPELPSVRAGRSDHLQRRQIQFGVIGFAVKKAARFHFVALMRFGFVGGSDAHELHCLRSKWIRGGSFYRGWCRCLFFGNGRFGGARQCPSIATSLR